MRESIRLSANSRLLQDIIEADLLSRDIRKYLQHPDMLFRRIRDKSGAVAPMTFEEADHRQANVTRNDENCAACVTVHELHLRGFDITAKPYA